MLAPIHETSGSAHQRRRRRQRTLHFRSKTTDMQDSLTAAIV
jgi:hypothetical protein